MRIAIAAAVACLSFVGLSVATDVQAAVKKNVNIPAGGLGPALRAFSEEQRVHIVFISEDVDKLSTQGASGSLSVDEVLHQLLQGTGLTYQYIDAETVSILPIPMPTASETAAVQTRKDKRADGLLLTRVHLAQVTSPSNAEGGHEALSAAPAATAASDATAASGASAAKLLEEVIVSAQKREQNLQDVGISVTAYTGDQMKDMGMTNTVDLATMTPGLRYAAPHAESSTVNFFLRGVGLNAAGDQLENPVAVYVDGVYRAAMAGLNLQNFDVERAEVLRGPQGTLFGRNSSGGLIQFLSKKPTDRFGAYLEIGAESYNTIKTEAMINAPLTDELAARLSIATNKNEGMVKNDFTDVDPITGGRPGDYSETNAVAARGQLLWKPNDSADALLRVYYSRNRGQAGAWQNKPTTYPNIGTVDAPIPDLDRRVDLGPNEVNLFCSDPTPAGTDCQGFRDTDGDPHRGSFDRDGDTGVWVRGISSEINWSLANGWELTSITSYDTVRRLQEEDTDASPFYFPNATFRSSSEQFTQEVRLFAERDRWRWNTGAYYFNWDVENRYNLALVPGFFENAVDGEQKTASWALLGQLEYDVSDTVTLIGGLRYTREKKTMDYVNVDRPGADGLVSFLTGIGATSNYPSGLRPTPDTMLLFNRSTVGDLAEQDEGYVTSLAEIDWKPKDGLLIYGKYSVGVKSAGFNATFLDVSGVFSEDELSDIPFKKETLNSYEVGVKSSILGGSAYLNASAFYYDYKDYQTYRFTRFSAVVFNTDAEVYGGEVELRANLTRNLDLMLGVSVLQATAKNIPTPATGIEREVDMVAAPDFTANGMLRYQWPLFEGSMAAVASFYWQDDTWYDIQNFDVSRADGYLIGNLHLKWTSQNDKWVVSAFVDNVADKEFVTYTYDFTGPGGFNQVSYGRPRWIGGAVKYSW